MFTTKQDKYYINWVDVSDKPISLYVSADWKEILEPTEMESREHRIDCADENEWLFDLYFHWELVETVRWLSNARKRMQYLIDEEDYYNGNEKDYWELEI